MLFPAYSFPWSFKFLNVFHLFSKKKKKTFLEGEERLQNAFNDLMLTELLTFTSYQNIIAALLPFCLCL